MSEFDRTMKGKTMSLARLLEGGIERIVDLAKADQLERRFLWVALKGAWKYARAAATGDVAHPDEQLRRVMTCAGCDALDRVQTSKSDIVSGYCGKTETTGPNPTCGCLVMMTVGITISAAGKTKVASECCPRDRWNAAPRSIESE